MIGAYEKTVERRKKMLYFLTKILKPSVSFGNCADSRRREGRKEGDCCHLNQENRTARNEYRNPCCRRSLKKKRKVYSSRHCRRAPAAAAARVKGLWRTQEEGKAERRSLSLTD
jgi:hypothetical protein